MYVDYDEIVKEWAWRVPNGKPNLSNPYHKEKLREVLLELNYPLDLLSETKTISDVRAQIVKGLGSKLGLAGPKTMGNITSTKGVDSQLIAKEVGKLLGVQVIQLNPGQKQGRYENKSSKYDSIAFTLDGKDFNFKISLSSLGAGIPPDAAGYERGLCVEYNRTKNQKLTTEELCKLSKVDYNSDYKPYEAHLTDVCGKVVAKVGNLGGTLVQTGGDKISPSSKWPTSEPTPKTDIYGGSNYRISVKKEGGSQLSSGGGGDSKGIFLGAKAFFEKQSGKTVATAIDNMIQNMEQKFKKFNTDNSVGRVRKSTGEAYITYRTPEIDKIVKKKKIKGLKKDASLRHAKSELMAAGIIGEAGNWSEWPIEGVPVSTKTQVIKWFNNYWPKLSTQELQEEARDLVNLAIDHKTLQTEIQNLFQHQEFKKWAVFEAATGNYKFSGDDDIKSNTTPIANKILSFNTSGGGKIIDITPSWCSGKASQTSVTVGFKSSGRSSFTSMRLLTQEQIEVEDNVTLYEKDFNNIISEELKMLGGIESELLYEVLEEGFFGDGWNKIKSLGKALLNSMKKKIKAFYENVISKLIVKIKEYAKQGFDFLMNALGIEVNGSINVGVSF
tara:strand:- start:1049 stop:2887 length:1839 start_codon:yes stop_codon:yes gene_type:complete